MNGPATASDPWALTILEAASLMRSRALSATELVESVLARAEQTEPSVHAWVSIDDDGARTEARLCDEELAKGETRGPLHGIPIGIKDIFDVEGAPTKCGSRSRDQAERASEDAAVVRLLRESGAIILGKTVTQEFAAGVISPPARNPWNPDRIPGGSSGGTAASIAAGSALAGMGSDTGGSIRIPASVCGVVGFKPTFGVLDTYGVYPLSWSLDTVGPLARTIDDATLLYRVMQSSGRRLTSPSRPATCRIGIARPHFFERLQPGVAAAIDSAIGALRAAGITIIESPWPEAGIARASSFIINRVESSAVHIADLPEKWGGYGEELRLRIESGALVPANAYVRAMQARRIIADSCRRVFEAYELDAMLTPATPGVSAPADDPVVSYEDGTCEHVSLAYTRLSMPFNVTGQPALSIPCGFDGEGLPVGLQLAGRPYADEHLLAIGRRVEDALAIPREFPLV